jgi:two-component system, NtrC family, nitrogen regulation sensor histidine kinase NtrY
MIYKAFYRGIIIRLSVFAILAVSLGYFASQQYWILFGIACLLVLLSGGNLIYYINAINRELTLFFDAMHNEDTSVIMNEGMDNRSLRELHQSMNKVKEHISDIKIQNEKNEKFFKELLQNSASGLMAVDSSGYVEMVNDSALRLIGLQYISHIRLLEQKNKALYNAFLELKPGQTKTIKSLDRAELKLLSLKVSMLRFDNKKYRLFSINDIKSQMEESEIDTWQKLIRVLTHEIMNSVAPLTSLSNSLKRFLTENGDPKSAGEVSQRDVAGTLEGLKTIEERGKGLMHFVDDYRTLTKVPKPVFTTVDVNEWLSKNCLLIQPQINEEGIDLEVVRKNKNPEFIGDEKLLSQVLINILNNAIDALKGRNDKKITIKITDNPRGNLIISIIDNGKGIKQEDLEKIFLPFYTTKEEGSGIGLSLSRQIMRMHKGSIDIRSVPDRKTVVKLAF